MAHWIRQQMISSCCRGHSTSKGRGWGQDSTPLWLMTRPQQRLPVGKNVTQNWKWRGPTLKLHLTRLQNKTKLADTIRGQVDGLWLKHSRPLWLAQSQKWNLAADGLTRRLRTGLIILYLKKENKHGCFTFEVLLFCFDVFREAFPPLWPFHNNSSSPSWTTWSFNWNQARVGIKHATTWLVILLGPIITLLISIWLSRRKRDRANLWSLTRWHKAFQASRRSSAKVISTN